MSIRIKIILTFSILTLLVGVFLSAYLNSYLRSVFATEIKNHLRSVAEISEGSYFVFTENIKTRTVDWSSDGYIRKTAERITDAGASSAEKGKLGRELNAYLKEEKIIYDPTVIIIDVLDKEGIVIASSREDRIGVDEGEEERNFGAVRFSEAIKSNFGEAFVTSVVEEEDESDRGMTHVTARIFPPKNRRLASPLPPVLLASFCQTEELSDMLNGNWQEKVGAYRKFFGSIHKKWRNLFD